VLPAHRGTMRSVRPVAATVPASAAQPELVTAAGPESAAVRRTGPPERRTPPALWPIQDNKKARVTNSVLEASQLSLLATGRITAWLRQIRYQLATSMALPETNCRNVSGHAGWLQ